MEKYFIIISSIEIIDVNYNVLNYPVASVFTEQEEKFVLENIDKLDKLKIQVGSQEVTITKEAIKDMLKKKFEFKKCHADIFNKLKFCSKDIINDTIQAINFDLDIWMYS